MVGVDWREQLGDRLISAERAAELVQSGDRIYFTMGREAHAVGLAIAARMGELHHVQVRCSTPGYDFGWYDEGWQDAFEVSLTMPTGVSQEAFDARRVDLVPRSIISQARPNADWTEPDILLTEVSPPDRRGFCSFGQSLWNKRKQIADQRRHGKPVIAEVNENLIRTFGNNFIHISEIDYFVEHVGSGSAVSSGTLAGRAKKDFEPYHKAIAELVRELIRDGDCLQIGVGRTTEPLATLGAFDGKHDLGYHSEATPPGIITLVREGVINGSRKPIHPGKVIVTSLGGGTKQEMEWAGENPIFELNDFDYVADPRVISSNDQMVAINNVLTIDLCGQMTAETVGRRVIAGPGGQPSFMTGAMLSKGGRCIHVLPSTALDGKVSRIVPELPEGTVVTVPRYMADYVVTEYGVARLFGESLRKRAEALIAIAHPDFRSELRKEAQRRLWP